MSSIRCPRRCRGKSPAIDVIGIGDAVLGAEAAASRWHRRSGQRSGSGSRPAALDGRRPDRRCHPAMARSSLMSLGRPSPTWWWWGHRTGRSHGARCPRRGPRYGTALVTRMLMLTPVSRTRVVPRTGTSAVDGPDVRDEAHAASTSGPASRMARRLVAARRYAALASQCRHPDLGRSPASRAGAAGVDRGAPRRASWGTPAATGRRGSRRRGRRGSGRRAVDRACGSSSIAAHGSPSAASRAGTVAIVSSSGWIAASSSQRNGVDTWAPTRDRTHQAPNTVLCGAFWLKSMNTREPAFLLPPLAGDQVRAALLHRAGDGDGGLADVEGVPPGLDAHVHVEAAVAGGLRERGDPELDEEGPHLGRRLAEHVERHARATGRGRCAARRSRPGRTPGTATGGTRGSPGWRPTARGRGRPSRSPATSCRWASTRSSSRSHSGAESGIRFWKKFWPLDAVGPPLQQRRPVTHGAHQRLADGHVVVGQVELGLAPLGEHHLVRAARSRRPGRRPRSRRGRRARRPWPCRRRYPAGRVR